MTAITIKRKKKPEEKKWLPQMATLLILGSLWAHQAWGAYWSWDPKETAALFTFLVYGAYLHTRTLRGWRGRRSAVFLALAFCAVIFTYFAVPREYQHRVLFWGIIGAIVFRAIFISAGAAVVNSWTWILYIFAAFLIFTGWKMLRGHGQEMKLEGNAFLAFVRRRIRVSDTIENHNFFVRRPHPSTGKLVLFATPLFLALIMVEAADIVFAVDSVPAIFAVTRDPFIVYTSNIFAILGLRALYFAIAGIMGMFEYLNLGLCAILVFIGIKMLLHSVVEVPILMTLGVIVGVLAVSIGASILWGEKK